MSAEGYQAMPQCREVLFIQAYFVNQEGYPGKNVKEIAVSVSTLEAVLRLGGRVANTLQLFKKEFSITLTATDFRRGGGCFCLGEETCTGKAQVMQDGKVKATLQDDDISSIAVSYFKAFTMNDRWTHKVNLHFGFAR